jgi:Mn2+/Fe2+ NRAMP family transporter
VNKTFKEAPQFMWIYTFMIAASSLLILIPGAHLVFLMVLASIVNGLLLPFVLIYALKLVNNKKLMGDYVNPKLHNIVSWGTVLTLTLLTIVFVITLLLPIGIRYG